MKKGVYSAGSTPAAAFAAEFLASAGLQILDSPTNADYILLDVPSFHRDGQLRSGNSLTALLSQVPDDICFLGGGLGRPELAPYPKVDLLEDPIYLAENAYITAEAALDVALPYLSVTLRDCPVLILGWGRIGKCLARLLGNLNAGVTVAVRRESDLAMLRGLGYEAVYLGKIPDLCRYRLIFNTVPSPVMGVSQLASCHPECVKIDLASRPGLEGTDVIAANGLPGIHFPESSGKLIAQTILRKENLP